MKTTLNIDDRLLADAKSLAAQQRTTLTRLVEEGLAMRLKPSPRPAKKLLRRLPVFRGGSGLVPGINALSNKAMFAAIDDDA